MSGVAQDSGFLSRTFESDDLESAVELCYRQGWSDGLPVIPPTSGSVRKLLDHLGRDPAEVVGIVPPRNGIATIEKIAANCVMAGCRPEYVPVVIAALQTMLREEFNLNGVQTTTHPCAPLLIVSGPLVKQLGFNTRDGVFGHGCRPSAAIGRALRLILWNIGGGYPGEPCKTTISQPGYYSFCVAEDEDSNPWEPLSVEHGCKVGETLLTVASVEGPRLIVTGGGISSAQDTLYTLADSIAVLGTANLAGGDMVLILGPMTAKNLSDAGLSKAGVKDEIMKLATRSVRDARRRPVLPDAHPMHWNKVIDANDEDARVPFVRSADNLILLVAGGWGASGAMCALCPGWGADRGATARGKFAF